MSKSDIENKYRHPDDEPLSCSVNEIENFRNHNPVWKEMVKLLEERKEMLNQDLRTAKTVVQVRGIQRSLDQIDDILEMPKWFLVEQREEQKLAKENLQ